MFLAAAAAKLYLQNRMMSGDMAHMGAMAMATHWGAAWRLQLAAGVVALIGLVLASRRATSGWALAALASLTLAASMALGAHAAAAQRLHAVSIVADSLHIIGAAGWLGSLLWLVVVGISRRIPSNEGRGPRVAALVRAFSPVALSFAALVTITGLTSAWLRLGTVTALWGTSYGQVLLIKLLVLVGVASTGFYNWKRVQPTLGTDAATSRLARVATTELVIGLLVVIVTAVLVAMPTPLDGVS
jgi:putative copper resistance protein D